MFQRTTAVQIIIIVSLSVWKLAYSGKNLALRKPALQSTNWSDELVAEKSVDGNRNGYHHAGSCSHTAGGTGQWWLVDLMGVYLVNSVVIYNRDDNQGRLDNAYVEGFLHYPLLCRHAVPQICAHNPGPSGDVVNLTCVQEMRARYIKLTGTWLVNVCEVEVFGENADGQWCSKRTVHIEKQDGRRLPSYLPTVDLGHASSSRNCSYLCLQRPQCHVYNYNSLTGDCKVPQKLFNNVSEVSGDWALYWMC